MSRRDDEDRISLTVRVEPDKLDWVKRRFTSQEGAKSRGLAAGPAG